MTKNGGVRVDAPSDDPKSWKVRVAVRGGTLQFEVSTRGPWCTDRFDSGGRHKPNLYVPPSEFLAARSKAGREFAELYRLRAKSAGDAKKTA